MIGKISLYIFVSLILQIFITTNLIYTGILLFAIILFTDGLEELKILFTTLPRDLRAFYILKKFNYIQKNNLKQNLTIPRLFDQRVHLNPHKIALQQEDRKWTFQDLHGYSCAYANFFHRQGIRHGDTVALFVDNRLEFVALWLGLARIGALSALLNFNLTKDALVHCIKVSEAKSVVFVGRLKPVMDEVKSSLGAEMKYYVLDEEETAEKDLSNINIDEVLRSGLRIPPPEPQNLSYNDKMVFIYTSGTTGLPKAAVISHSRYFYMAAMSHFFVGYNKNDSIYCTLPLYHSNGGILGVGQCLLFGLTLTVRSKFSASRFWTECKKYNCTVFLYIGEICRYLLAQPERQSDRDHYVRCGSGNGLRPEIWCKFVQRFNISKIAELYGATEGNASMMNITNTEGSCGFVSVIAPSFYPLSLVEVDEDMQLIRDKNGLCIKSKIGSPGMLVAKILKQGTQRFEGYADKKETAKKIAFDVFEKGDSVFLTGDVLVQDKYGNMYFKDRTGDTFRWKGENVSTAECEAELAKAFNNHFTIAVYGVSIPGTDGKAGMVSLEDPNQEISLERFYEESSKVLPSYARPLLVRVLPKLPMTGTHKLAKSGLRKEGFDVTVITDPIFVVDHKLKSYRRVDAEVYQDIISGKLRL